MIVEAGISVHLLNSVVAWLDILLSHPRSFSRRSQNLSIGLVIFYLHWILLCSYVNGLFPYPFLNKLPQPQVRFCCLLLESQSSCNECLNIILHLVSFTALFAFLNCPAIVSFLSV